MWTVGLPTKAGYLTNLGSSTSICKQALSTVRKLYGSLFVQFWAARGFCQRVLNSRIATSKQAP